MSANPLSDRDVWKVFKGRCLICYQSASEIHEIVPRSQDKNWNRWDNRVLLCKAHHTWVHAQGAKLVAPTLTGLRELRLKAYYGKDDRETIRKLLFD